MRRRVKKYANSIYYWLIGACLIVILFIEIFKKFPEKVELYYVNGLYPITTNIYKYLFSWLPFSIGDLVYLSVSLLFIYICIKFILLLFKRKFSAIGRLLLKSVTLILCLYSLFYVNWGLNYFRISLVQEFDLPIDSITHQQHLRVLEEYIVVANSLREELDLAATNRLSADLELEQIATNDSIFDHILSKKQIHIKKPISSTFASYFSVSGYFNPFTQEVQVNDLIPNAGYPFTCMHELAHQQGRGFEDECNFIAFVQLRQSANTWYRYSAYYSAIQYLFAPLRSDEILFEKYKAMLSEKVKHDLREEREFWQAYRGWVDDLSAIFYNQYLKHNNQPEGLERYNMMTKLILAWELKKGN